MVPTERHVELTLAAREPTERLFVRTWQGLLLDLAAEYFPDQAFARPCDTRLAAREALEELGSDRVRSMAEPAERATLAHAIDGAIGALRRSGAEPSHLYAVNTPKATLLADVMDRVNELLKKANLIDFRGISLKLARQIHGRTLDAESVNVRGIATWETDDLALLEAMHGRIRAGKGKGVTIELPRLKDGDDAMNPIGDTLERRWGKLLDNPELLWRESEEPMVPQAIRARTLESEARAIVSSVLTALNNQTPPERIAVVVPELSEARLEPLRAAFLDARVPFCEPLGRPLLSSPAVRAALLLLELAEGPVTREKVMDLVRAPGLLPTFLAEKTQEHRGKPALLAERLREVPVEVDRTGKLLLEGLISAIGQNAEEAWMSEGLRLLLQRARWIMEGACFGEVPRRFAVLVEQMGIGKPTDREIGSAIRFEGREIGSSLSLRSMAEGAQSVRKLRELALSIAAAAHRVGASGRPCTPRDLLLELEKGAEGMGVLVPGSSRRASTVRIALPEELCDIEHDLLLVTGLSAHSYGVGGAADDHFLDERIRNELPPPLRPLSMRDRDQARRAELSWAMARARQVVLSFAPVDEQEENQAHPLWLWAMSSGAQIHREPPSRVSRGASRVNRRGAELVALARGAAPDASLAERVQIEEERSAFFLDPRRPAGRFSGKLQVSDDLVKTELKKRIGGAAPELPIAVTHIERAAECAFAGFARRVLRARRFEDLLESADARERGTMVHRALHAAFLALVNIHYLGKPAELLKSAKTAAEEELGAHLPMTPLRKEAVSRAVSDALGVIAKAIEDGDPLHFAYAEKRFGAGEKGEWKALALEGEGETPPIYVDGQIDRIDHRAQGGVTRVIDYKSSLPTSAARKTGAALQLPLYAAAAQRAMGGNEVKRVYLAIKKRGEIEAWPREEKEQTLSPDDIAQAITKARQVVLKLWEGDVAARPARKTLCERCDVRDVCRRPAVMPMDEDEEEG